MRIRRNMYGETEEPSERFKEALSVAQIGLQRGAQTQQAQLAAQRDAAERERLAFEREKLGADRAFAQQQSADARLFSVEQQKAQFAQDLRRILQEQQGSLERERLQQGGFDKQRESEALIARLGRESQERIAGMQNDRMANAAKADVASDRAKLVGKRWEDVDPNSPQNERLRAESYDAMVLGAPGLQRALLDARDGVTPATHKELGREGEQALRRLAGSGDPILFRKGLQELSPDFQAADAKAAPQQLGFGGEVSRGAGAAIMPLLKLPFRAANEFFGLRALTDSLGTEPLAEAPSASFHGPLSWLGYQPQGVADMRNRQLLQTENSNPLAELLAEGEADQKAMQIAKWREYLALLEGSEDPAHLALIEKFRQGARGLERPVPNAETLRLLQGLPPIAPPRVSAEAPRSATARAPGVPKGWDLR